MRVYNYSVPWTAHGWLQFGGYLVFAEIKMTTSITVSFTPTQKKEMDYWMTSIQVS